MSDSHKLGALLADKDPHVREDGGLMCSVQTVMA
jgi:hypothetical protein